MKNHIYRLHPNKVFVEYLDLFNKKMEFKKRIFLISFYSFFFFAQLAPHAEQAVEQWNELTTSAPLIDSSEVPGESPERELAVGLNYDFPTYEFIDDKGIPNRIKAIIIIHEKFYQSKFFSLIDMSSYLVILPKQFSNSHRIDKHFKLITNSLKYNCTNRNVGKQEISFSSPGLQESVLLAHHDGDGLPKNCGLTNPRNLGLNLVTILTKQLNGTVERTNTPAAKFVIKSGNRERS